MVVWYSLKTSKKYSLDDLKVLLGDLIMFHANYLGYYNANAGNQILINTDDLYRDLDWKLSLLIEQFELLEKPYYNRLDLSHIFTITGYNPNIEATYTFVDDPEKAKEKEAIKNFEKLKQIHPEFENFELNYNYER